MTAGSPPSTTATTEFVVPRSMPITFAMSCSLLSECLDQVAGPAGAERSRPGPPAPLPGVLGRLDLDFLRLALFRLRKVHRQHPVPVGRLDLPGGDWSGQRERAFELAEPTLTVVVARLLGIAGPLPLALDGEQVVGQGQMNVLLAEPRQLGADHELVLGLVHVRGGSPHPLYPPRAGRLAQKSVEESIHLGMDVGQVAGQLLRERTESNQRHESFSYVLAYRPCLDLSLYDLYMLSVDLSTNWKTIHKRQLNQKLWWGAS